MMGYEDAAFDEAVKLSSQAITKLSLQGPFVDSGHMRRFSAIGTRWRTTSCLNISKLLLLLLLYGWRGSR